MILVVILYGNGHLKRQFANMDCELIIIFQGTAWFIIGLEVLHISKLLVEHGGSSSVRYHLKMKCCSEQKGCGNLKFNY